MGPVPVIVLAGVDPKNQLHIFSLNVRFLQESGILFVIGWEYFQHFRMSVWLTWSNSKV
jgi:hypothetical protein